MKAAVLEQLDSPLVIRHVQTSDLKIGQVLVKVLVSGLCGAQLLEISGHKGNAKFLPHLMGHEGCGIVEFIGPGVTKVKPGDKVVMHWRVGSGIESPFPEYTLDGKKITSGKVTTLSEYSIVSENRITVVPPSTPDNLCALLGCGLTTALGVINNDAQVKFGESVMVVGCGGVGLNLIQGARLASAYPIIAVDTNASKESLALSNGATRFVHNSVSLDLISDRVDVIIDTTGNKEAIKNTIPLLNDGGRYIFVAQTTPGSSLEIPSASGLFSSKGKSFIASQGGKTNPDTDIPRYVKLQAAGLIDIEKLITHTFQLDDINQAINLLRNGTAGRIMIRTNL